MSDVAPEGKTSLDQRGSVADVMVTVHLLFTPVLCEHMDPPFKLS